MGISRRKVLAGVAMAGAFSVLVPAGTAFARRRKTLTLTAVATRKGEYLYLTFQVPRRANRLDVKLMQEGSAEVGVGLFDLRGAGYQSPGFRGIYGEEKSELHVGAKSSSRPLLPGRMDAGEWTVIVPVFSTAGPSRITAPGRELVTRMLKGAQLHLSATGPGGQTEIVGGMVYGGPSDVAEVSVLVKGGSGMRLILLRDGEPVLTAPVTSDEQTVALSQPTGTGGYVRAELRGEPVNPRAGRLDMEALTPPIFLAPEPSGITPRQRRRRMTHPRPDSAPKKWLPRAFRPGALALAGLLAAAAISLAAPSEDAGAKPSSEAPECAPGVDFLGFSDALNKRTYEGTTVGGLSALAYDGGRRGSRDIYQALVDNGPTPASEARFYTLRLPTSGCTLGEQEILDVTTLEDYNGVPFTASNFDGEGLTRAGGGDLLASSETEPSIRRFSLNGTLLEELPVPQKVRVAPAGEGRANQTFESLALAPNGRALFKANEGSLAADGETADGGDRLRILRYEKGRGGFEPAEEFYYLAESGQGVVEISALSRKELLVLERGFVSGAGNTVRVFRVSLKGAEDVSDEATLATPGLVPVKKELLVDLADCPSSGATSPSTQENPLLDNFEALTLGPKLPGGRRALLLVSDDNFSAGQVTRIVALGARLR